MVLKEEAQTVKKCLSADFSVQLQWSDWLLLLPLRSMLHNILFNWNILNSFNNEI